MEPATISRLVVPLDGSALAERAIGPAADLARRAGAPMTLLTVVDDDRRLGDADDELAVLAKAVEPRLEVETAVRVADASARGAEAVAAAIVDEAAADGALVVMGSHGRGGVGQAVLGSVAEAVLRRTIDPVLVIGPAYRRDHRIGGGSLVVGLDGSRLAERVLDVAVPWSEQLDLPLWLVQVLTSDDVDALDAGDPDAIDAGYLERTAAGIPSAGWDVLHAHHPAHGLVDLAHHRPTSLVALTTHGRTGLRRVTLGSVAMRVVHRAPCPVLLVCPEDDDG